MTELFHWTGTSILHSPEVLDSTASPPQMAPVARVATTARTIMGTRASTALAVARQWTSWMLAE